MTPRKSRKSRLPLPAVMLAAFAGGVMVAAASTPVSYTISQRGREFQPRQIAIKKGETLAFVNDDGDLLHHAYLAADKFSFDSGDQKPGTRFPVVFSEVGNYTVLCAIHPKMRLLVHVNN